MASEVRKKDVLQAVVLADDFTTSLTPMQKLYPSILMPVINVPLLDYMIETLVKSLVEEVFLYCSSHVDLLKKYVKNKCVDNITISLIISDGCRCLGDALRDIYDKGFLRGHFILIRGNAFTNTNLQNLINVHRTKCENDKGAVMTMVLRNIGATINTPFDEETTLIVCNKANNKILHYEKLRDSEKKVKMKIDWFLSHDEVRVCTCLLDTHIYMCSPSVLSLFADNFDFQTMDDFIRGVLSDEILDSRIYWQELNLEDYALPISSWKIYHTLTKDILCRNSYPLVPNGYFFSRDIIHDVLNFIYRHKSATLSKGCLLEKECFIGQNSTLGDNTTMRRSIIMDNCVIGSNVYIYDSYIFPNVKIENNCYIENSILFPNCVVRSNSQVEACILCHKVDVVANSHYSDTFVESSDQPGTKLSELHGNDGFYYFKSDDTVEDDYSSIESSSSETESIRCDSPDDTNMFLSEVIDSLLRGYQDKLKCENLILEINSSRYAYNVSVREVTHNVVKAILSLPLYYLIDANVPIDKQSYQKHMKAMLAYFNTIILNYVKNDEAQEDCLQAIEDIAGTTDELLSYTSHLLHIFYERDILSEEKILEWYESDSDSLNVIRKKVKDAALTFITWLREAEEDSSESDDDS